MMRFFSVLIIFILLSGRATAQDEPLPESVITPYTAFQAAEAAGDDAVAADSAEQAWRAGLAARIDPVVLGVLAENTGFYARRIGQYELAEEAFTNAVALNERTGGDPLVRARALRFVSDAQLRQGELREAYISAETAVRILETLPVSSPSDTEIALSYALMSSSRWVRGQYRTAGVYGERAVLMARRAGIQNAPVFGVAAFQAGATHSYGGRSLDAAYWLTVASIRLPQTGASADLSDAATAWGRMEREELSMNERAELLERLRDNQVYAQGDEASLAELVTKIETEDFTPTQGRVDAVARNRIPPQYPMAAAQAGVEGFALIRFDVNEVGEPINIEVVYSIPYREFGEEGVRTVQRWRYEPATQDGVPIVRRGVTTQLLYELAD